jgi:hypothetical protein
MLAEPLAVDVALVGSASSEGSLAVRIQSWFGAEAQIAIETASSLSAERVLAPPRAGHVAVWVTLRSTREARLYFAAPSERGPTPLYLVRDVPLDGGLDEIGSERVAQVVHSSVSALIEGAIEATTRPELERALEQKEGGASTAVPNAPIAPQRREREPKLPPGEGLKPTALAGAFYRAALTGEEGLAHGPGATLGMGLTSGAYGLTLLGRGAYVLPRSVSLPGLTLTLSGPWARAGLRLTRELGVWRGELELGAGLDWARWDAATPSGSDLVGRASSTDRRSFVFASLGGSFAFGDFRLGTRVELSNYTTLTRYAVADDALLLREVGQSSRFQPALMLEAHHE